MSSVLIAALSVEGRKLNRSLAGLLVLAAPCLIPLFTFFNLSRAGDPAPWTMVMLQTSAIWAFFMLPMSVTALTALVGQMEHAPRSWDHLRALPVPRWAIYGAKALWMLALVALMTAATFGLTVLSGWLAGVADPADAPTGDFETARYVATLSKIFLASLLLTAVQLWLALRFASFVPALATGIGGTFFSTIATSAEEGVYFPWQMPVNMLATDAGRVELALSLGGGLGALALLAVVLHLSRREVL